MSAGFKLRKYDDERGFSPLPISSITVVKDDLLELKVGATVWTLVTSTSDHFTRKAIAMDNATTSDTEINAYELEGDELVEVQSANASNVAHNGDRMIATDENTINNTGTDAAGQKVVFLQTGVIGASSDNRIQGRVLVGSGVDPDAA